MQRYALVLLIGFTLCCAAYDQDTGQTSTERTDHQPAPPSEFSNFASSLPIESRWWEVDLTPVSIFGGDMELPVMLSLTDSNETYVHFYVLSTLVDTNNPSIVMEWGYAGTGPWISAEAKIVRNPWEDVQREDTLYLSYRATWQFWARDVVVSGSCVPIYIHIAVTDQMGLRVVSEPNRYWMLVYEIPLHLWVDSRYCDWYSDEEGKTSGYRLTAPLVLMGAELRQHSIDPRRIVNVDLYKKPHSSPDVYSSWEKIETSITTDSLTTEGGARLSKWRWFVHVSTWTSPVNLRLVIYYEDGSISWDCDGDGKFDDHTLLLEDGGMAQFWPYHYQP